MQTYGIKELRVGEASSSSANERRELRQSYPHIIDDNIVGLENDIKKLVSVVVDEESECRVVSICGMGGLGKTTLAKKVYHHYKVKDQFNHLAWVYVSQQCHRRNVWEGILSGFNIMDKEDRKKRDEELAEKLFNFLKDEKCLVILDDIWGTEAWDIIKPGFPTRETRSMILLTSRNREVASHADTRGYLHQLQCLSYEESWELFQNIAFSRKDSTEFNYQKSVVAKKENLGRDMVKYCAGLPLAITVLGGILATKNSLTEWQMVSENVKSYLKIRGKGQGLEDVLALSYDDLPPYLRPCFLYLSHFPEDYEIDAHRLIQLWVAEGIVSLKQEGDGREIPEDVAERYLIELVERYMIQVRKIDSATLKIKTFHMHDLMRDLCSSKAKQENFLFIVDQSNADSLSQLRRARRVSAHQFFRIQRIKSPNLRSLLFFDDFFPEQVFRQWLSQALQKYLESDENLNPLVCIGLFLTIAMFFLKCRSSWKYMFTNFKLLRVLNLEGGGKWNWKLQSGIGNLIHLRFLSLRDVVFQTSSLPLSFGNLRCLRTLDLRGGLIIHVPDVIWRMKQLRHLYLPLACDYKTKLKLDTLRNLQTLVNFNTRNCYIKDLINMTNIRVLGICWPFCIQDFNHEDLDKNPPTIDGKYLHSLSIVCRYKLSDIMVPRHLTHLLSSCVSTCKLSLNVKIGKIPEYYYLPSNIAYICLYECELEEDPMPTLGKLLNLRILKLKSEDFNGKELVCSAEHFPKLEYLSLKAVVNLEWKVDEGALTVLRRLKIRKCGMTTLPDGLRYLTKLQELEIESMPKAFKDKVVGGGEDFCKVQHIPRIIFQNCNG